MFANAEQAFFKELLKEAKQHVQEPPQQPKIKLKVPQNVPAAGQPKKITIHVAGGKDSATGSPILQAAQSTEGDNTRNGTPMGRAVTNGPAVSQQLEKTRSASTSIAPPSPSVGAVKPEEVARGSPAIPPPGPAMTTQQQFAPVMNAPGAGVMNGVPAAPPVPKLTAADILEAQKHRPHPISKFLLFSADRCHRY